MKLKHCLLTLVALFVILQSYAQRATSPVPVYNYYYDYKLVNPAFTGRQGKHVITTSLSRSSEYAEFFYGSYELNLQPIKSAIGAIASFEEMGVRTGFHVGAFFNKQIPLSETSGLKVGTQLFYNKRHIDYEGFVVDPNDPLAPKETQAGNVSFDMGAVYYWKELSIGLAAKNVLPYDGEQTAFSLLAERKFDLLPAFSVTPSLLFLKAEHYDAVSVNAIFEIKKTLLLGAGYFHMKDSDGDLTFSGGVNIKDKVQFIGHVYSSNRQDMRPAQDSQVEFMLRVRIPDTANAE
jgi:type IX secretion system PorP/SprF family membrane protein